MENDTVALPSQQRNNFLSCKVWEASTQDLIDFKWVSNSKTIKSSGTKKI